LPKQLQTRAKVKLAGVELYFDDLERARRFYRETLGLVLTEETPGHHAQFDAGNCFVCLERKGAENYTSQDKAVLFFEVPDLRAVMAELGPARIVASETTGARGRQSWAVLHDPEGHNILLLECRKRRRSR
jgi:catechol 2,3-dioxygenase-like lactoylglutathione lyase family enzyme